MNLFRAIWAVKKAKKYTDQTSTAALSDAKDYADTVAASAETTAKAYADTRAAAAQSAAISAAGDYTDDAVAAALEAVSSGMSFQGTVQKISDLPVSSTVGYTYVVVYGTAAGDVVTNSLYVYTSNGWVDISMSAPIAVKNKDDNQNYKISLYVENGHLVSKMAVS